MVGDEVAAATKPQTHPRLFSRKVKEECWRRAMVVPGRDPDRWRYDAAGNVVGYDLRSCVGCLCHDYDHIVPFSKGGLTVLENCQVLQVRANRLKGNQDDDPEALRKYSCAHKFTKQELDFAEMAVYGNVRDGNGKVQCRCRSVIEMMETFGVWVRRQPDVPECQFSLGNVSRDGPFN